MLANGVPLEEIQEWLGHSDFSTTANVYSHLDFNSKIKAANTIMAAYNGNDAVVSDKTAEDDNLDMFRKMTEEMQKLGFTSIDDYLAYKKNI